MSSKQVALNRREALQRIGIVGIGAVAAACGSSDGDSRAEPTITPSTTASSAPTPTRTPSPTGVPTAAPSFTGTPASAASPTPSATNSPSATATPSEVPPPTASPTASPSSTPSPSATPAQVSCILTPEQILGPFFIDVGLSRTDIREDREGVPLRLVLQLVDVDGCTPIRDAVVNAWHADAAGTYSGFPNQPGGIDTTGDTYLRGFQVTDADGRVEFITIYPGWYTGRTVHIHVRIHLDATTVLVTQLYFPEPITDAVHAQSPYTSRGPRDTTNAADGIFDDDLVLDVLEENGGYSASIVLGVAL